VQGGHISEQRAPKDRPKEKGAVVTTPRKPTAREIWEAIEKGSVLDEVDRINGMSVEELKAELLKDGFRPEDFAPPEATGPEQAKPENAGSEEARGTAPVDG
jgi:hypothetical protein